MYGIVIVFLNNEIDLEANSILELFRIHNDVKFCLINNGSDDQTLKMLNALMTEYPDRIRVLDIKKSKNFKAAVKAGIRCLECEYDLGKVGYIDYEDVSDINLFIQRLRSDIIWETQFKQAVSKEIEKYNLGRELFRNACSLRTILY